ncbi:MAG: hypothetical protein AB7S44_00570 [Spirochaetales bacterium]
MEEIKLEKEEEFLINSSQNNSEQPIKTDSTQAVSTENLNDEEVSDEFLEGSPVGKFKDTKSLLEAYNNLQSEFTRKSQKLSQVLKDLSEKTENVTPVAPEFGNNNQKLDEFFKNTPQAKNYATEIIELVKNDNVLSKLETPFELAYSKILAGKYRSNEVLSEDEDFIENYILNNKKVKEKIIQNYLTSLKENRGATVMTAHTGSAFSLAPKNKPKNLDEAKELAKAFFKI